MLISGPLQVYVLIKQQLLLSTEEGLLSKADHKYNYHDDGGGQITSLEVSRKLFLQSGFEFIKMSARLHLNSPSVLDPHCFFPASLPLLINMQLGKKDYRRS